MRPPALCLLLTLASCGHSDALSTSPAVEISPSPTALVDTEIASVAEPSVELASVELASVEPPPAAPEPKLLGTFQLTYYWMALEGKRGAKDTTIYTPSCKPLAKVSKKYARRLAMEGTGKLRDGRTINVARSCGCNFSPCFFVAKKSHRWGTGVKSRPLSPFRSIAVDAKQIPYGTKVYIAELDGLTMPGTKPYGGFVHDGCVTADDTGGGVKGRQVDFFAAKWRHYKALHRRHKLTHVTVYDGAIMCNGDRVVERANRNSI